MEHLNLGRFTCGVDDYFLCVSCNGVVYEPVECSNCEDLLCSGCADNITTCPSCHENLETRVTSRYALQIYSQLTLRCHNFLQGCNQEGLIKDTLKHQGECEYEIFQCSNPLCLESKMRIDKYCDDPLVCSENCKLVVSFDRILKTRDQNLILTTLHTYLKELKEKELAEVTEKIRKSIEILDEKLMEKEEFATEEQELRDEIEMRRKKFHPGKWHAQGKYWVCCLNKSKLALGCKPV
ncbi:hypothetical protein SteCoe_33117 [Stentor coeruleus]|uniref:TRAF-type domain-containing protein n=1 Tax=Stentor coeruleus TaxID=5963 RepID=A0A1R2AXG5_9CILI|nr:hypothetical protein SteCoe_33117 [Stentor coeruleus]